MDLLPTHFIETEYLETASDDWFVDFNDDGLPELAVGRLPASTASELSAIVTKIIGYEQGAALTEAVLVADQGFEGTSGQAGALLPSGITQTPIYRSAYGNDDLASQALLLALDQGPLLVNYFGHGSVGIWQGDLLVSEDAPTLTNGLKLPVFLNMTCLNGYFQDLTESLAEALLKAPNGGAVAVWASSGLTEPEGQVLMDKEFLRLLFNGESLTIGEAARRAKASTEDLDVRKSWILFGDPTTKLKK